MNAQVLELDAEKCRVRIGMKQVFPTSLEEYISEHEQGEILTGRVTELDGEDAKIELAEGVFGTCRIAQQTSAQQSKLAEAGADLSSLTAMLQARWKGGSQAGAPDAEAMRSGQVRSFRITRLDNAAKVVELAVA